MALQLLHQRGNPHNPAVTHLQQELNWSVPQQHTCALSTAWFIKGLDACGRVMLGTSSVSFAQVLTQWSSCTAVGCTLICFHSVQIIYRPAGPRRLWTRFLPRPIRKSTSHATLIVYYLFKCSDLSEILSYPLINSIIWTRIYELIRLMCLCTYPSEIFSSTP